MGFFDFLGGLQDPTLSVTGEGSKKKKLPFAGETVEERDPLADALEYDAEHRSESDSNATKLKVSKAHSDINLAWGDALKAIAGAQQKLGPQPPEWSDPGMVQTERHLISAMDRASTRKDPVKLADDLQQIGAKLGDKNLITASQKLIRAAQAKAELEGMRKPGGPLAIDPKEVEQARQKLTQKQSQLSQELQTAGEIRTPQIQQQIEATKKELQRIAPAPMQAPTGEQPPAMDPNTPFGGDGRGPVGKYMDGLGIDHDDLVDRLHETMKIVGIPSDKWDEQVDPKAGIMRVVGSLDKNGDLFASLVTQGLAQARAEDQASAASAPAAGSQEDPAIAQTQGRIQGKEAELRALYGQLAQSPFMHTWPGVILYVLVGMITQNPAFAARLIGGVGNRDAIDREAKQLQFDIRRLDHELQYRVRNDQEAKREAARRSYAKQDRKDSQMWELGKMMLQHKLMIERSAKRQTPDTQIMKKLSSDFNRATAMAAKFNGTMNNILEPEEKRADAKRNFDFYMRRAAEIDARLRELGAEDLDDEEGAEEVQE